jgi:glycosyltransferase involved in cell wall biosynthesis
MLCTLYPRKRVYEVVLTLHELLQEGLDVHLHVAGGVVHGPDLDEYAVALQRLTDKLGLRSRITFYDHLADPAEWLSNIDIFISHSYWEGHQVALIEAMAAGCYCLAHFWDGADEVLPEDQLYATDSDLRRRVRAYLSMDPAARLKRRQEMRDVATRRFDIEQTKIAIRKTIADALEGRN